MELRVFREAGLNKEDRFLGVDSGTQPVEDDLPGVFLEAAGIGIIGGQGVPVGDKEVALVLVLQLPPVF